MVDSKPKTNRKDTMTISVPLPIIDLIDNFLKTPAAIRMGVNSRPQFVNLLTMAFLSKYDKSVPDHLKLLDITDEDIRRLLREFSVKD